MMLVASMDHSPQEIPSDRDVWHTTALVLSEGADQWGWDVSLGRLISPQSGKLQKWTKRNGARYQGEFRRQFPKALATSDLYCLAFSARGGTIVDALPQLIARSGLANNLLVSDGAVAMRGLSYGKQISIPTIQAAYVMYLLHFISRMHALILEDLKAENKSISWCDWQISPDHFALGIGGAMMEMFSASANTASSLGWINGNLRVLTFDKGDPGVDVCDNVAGMLRQNIERDDKTLARLDRPVKGKIYWEIH
jgi:hypothetical protein